MFSLIYQLIAFTSKAREHYAIAIASLGCYFDCVKFGYYIVFHNFSY